MRGRKSKYTPEVVQALIDAISAGLTNEHACAIAGIHEDTFYTWLNQKPDFSEAVTRARPAGWKTALEVIRREANNGDWRAAAEYLDRTKSPYRKSQEIALTGKDGGPLTITHIAVMPPTDITEALRDGNDDPS